eukprot:CAMPEP_0196572786 /NCGR_PEP_ID=MMETSP1081-20130531/2768_1 /TAXON_ID=36882 /ORGANISM="Pyramimonas amylifera, Strain CCMP720" /LENGTH=54 /DNA_ID=CAMNT_0041890219 /DNA_START=311 /DNA_END=475 /DNA_ORIENTATION=+
MVDAEPEGDERSVEIGVQHHLQGGRVPNRDHFFFKRRGEPVAGKREDEEQQARH